MEGISQGDRGVAQFHPGPVIAPLSNSHRSGVTTQYPPDRTRKDKRLTASSNLTTGPGPDAARVETVETREIKHDPAVGSRPRLNNI